MCIVLSLSLHDNQFISSPFPLRIVLEKLTSYDSWLEYYQYKNNNKFVKECDKNALFNFINNLEYYEISKKIVHGSYVFSHPKKHIINKHSSNKKRIVYIFKDDEMMILKYISYLLYKYDNLFENNLYSFRKNISIKDAVNSLRRIKNLSKMYGFKLDISNYFNSINPTILLDNLKKDVDEDFYLFSKKILLDEYVIDNDKLISEKKGVLAGSPISSFYANYYIREIDSYFKNEKVFYIRYADDIIIFSNTKEELDVYIDKLTKLLKKYKLSINEDKVKYFKPNDNIEFLGFEFRKNEINLTNHTILKMKSKIKRSARSYRRWIKRKNLYPFVALKSMIKKYNHKFFGSDNNELSWKYWFFPIITKHDRLNEIDKYLQDNLRFVYTGKHNKRNLEKVPYSMLKDLGYKTLVNEYYLFLDMINKV